ncbi:M1 family metallopeptidase [Thalassomonas actiniarum]|uniref:M1 family metallopeptidase n=1 Tax=Thalassomonas actiniarum TaxID=485447 RepID=A0AAE9YRB2_9GAMM|nr:M1 family metallopeptidase [Thalassomonas actiniarum]WDD99252.1 M1 family metallopeptidase [Thalassomonas actiniarum]
MKNILPGLALITLAVLFSPLLAAKDVFKQGQDISHQDVLRGSVTPERAWWDLSHYHLDIAVDPKRQFISGTNTMSYRVLSPGQRLQIELQPPMELEKVTQDGEALKVERDGYSYFITPNREQEKGEEYQLVMAFSGQPLVAEKPPWDGGITWQKDDNGIDFIASAVQGVGASVWWPNKDHAYDEPDNGALISVEVPEHLMDVSNGRLIKVEENPQRKTKTYHWQVVNPISNYGININIGDYVHFGDVYQGELGPLDLDYYVLRDNLTRAKKHFQDARRTLEAFEYWFGPYPFYEDGFKLVEAPYLGMEHQSSVTYGNGFQNGYKGRDRSGTGWGMEFDFIIVHEAGHEWFANNITHRDIADMWIHESFTNYSENLFVEYFYGKQAGSEYSRGTRQNVLNDKPIIGTYNANREGSFDMYPKGGNMLHTIRQVIDNDILWRKILRGLNKDFYHKTVTGRQVEQYISRHSGKDLSKIFEQYLRDVRVPVLEYFVKGKLMKFRWSNTVEGFDMPVKVSIGGEWLWLTPGNGWSEFQLKTPDAKVEIDSNFYISVLNILGN